MSSPRTSLAIRAFAALGLAVGFYALALTIAAFLIVAPLRFDGSPTLVLACFALAGMLLWSLAPRVERWSPFGVRVTADEQPRLFGEIASIAAATGQPMPNEVYLDLTSNAYVAQRGGIAGLFGRRVIGLGLPLFAVASTAEMRAILAHEFGHLRGGDLRLWPWIRATRQAIDRTATSFANHNHWLVLLAHQPLRLYGDVYLRVTHAIARRQEIAADAYAAELTSGSVAAGALRGVVVAGLVFERYYQSEYITVLLRGLRPPLVEGLRAYVAAAAERGLDADLARALAAERAEPSLPHPPYRERIAALTAMGGHRSADDPPALEWIACLQQLEALMDPPFVSHLAGDKLQPIAWSDVAKRVWIPDRRAHCTRSAKMLRDKCAADLPAFARAAEQRAEPIDLAERVRIRSHFVHLYGAALALALLDDGWQLHYLVGFDVRATKGERAVEPVSIVRDIVSGVLGAEDWNARACALGIAALPLAVVPLDGEDRRDQKARLPSGVPHG